MTRYVLAIDQGTTSTRAILFRADMSIAAVAQREFPQHFPADGEVEHEPEDLWTTTRRDLPRRHAQGRRRGARYCRHRHRQSARNHVAVGARHRRAAASRHRLAGPPHCGFLCAAGAAATSRCSLQRPACCSIRISPAPSSPGCCDHAPGAAAKLAHAANSPSARSTRICCGGSPAARCTPLMRPTHRAHCCSTFTGPLGRSAAGAARRAAVRAAGGAAIRRPPSA